MSRRALPGLSVVLLALVLAGCVPQQAARSPEGQPDSAIRKTLRTDGLEFSAQVASTSVSAGGTLPITLTLRNTSGSTLRWRDVRFGYMVATTHQADPNSPDSMSQGFGDEDLVGRGTPAAHPLVLQSGESTTVVYTTGVTAAVWTVVGSFAANGGERSGRTPTITATATPRP